jgi:hypothetical protein
MLVAQSIRYSKTSVEVVNEKNGTRKKWDMQKNGTVKTKRFSGGLPDEGCG